MSWGLYVEQMSLWQHLQNIHHNDDLYFIGSQLDKIIHFWHDNIGGINIQNIYLYVTLTTYTFPEVDLIRWTSTCKLWIGMALHSLCEYCRNCWIKKWGKVELVWCVIWWHSEPHGFDWVFGSEQGKDLD